MKIKTTRTTTFWQPILGLLVVAILLNTAINSGWLRQKKQTPEPILNFTAPPDSVLQFLQKEVSLPQVLDFFQKEEIYLAVKDDGVYKMPAEIKTYLEKLGSQEIQYLSFRDSYAAVIVKGEVVREQREQEKPVILEYQGVKVHSAGNQAGSFEKLELKNKTLNTQRRGLNVYIINRATENVFSYTFDYFLEAHPVARASGLEAIQAGVDRIEIILEQSAFEQLKAKRKAALAAGILLTEETDYVKGFLVVNGESHRVSLRLKGDWLDHLGGKKWSYRVKVEDGSTIKSMRKFSLHHPKTRNFAGEWLFHQVLEQEGILNLQYHFVNVELTIKDHIGGTTENLGLYALEESFDKQLIERGRRRESVILKLNEDPMWQELSKYSQIGLPHKALLRAKMLNKASFDILPFSEKKIRKDSTLFQQFVLARELFRSLRDGERTVSEVFDVELLAKYNAICNLMGAKHALVPHNYRVYFNPITARLEPIGFDANPMDKIYWLSSLTTYFGGMEDMIYMAAYAKAMREISEPQYLKKIFETPSLEAQIRLLQLEFPTYQFKFENLEHNQKILQAQLNPKSTVRTYLNAYQNLEMQLQVENYGKFPIEVIEIQDKGGRKIGVPASTRYIPLNAREGVIFKLDENFQQLFVSKKGKKVGFRPEKDGFDLRLIYRVVGTEKIYKSAVIPWSAQDKRLAENVLARKEPNMERFPFLEIDEPNKVIHTIPGDWVLDRNLVIPAGYIWKSQGDFRLDFLNGAATIISFSSLDWRGTAEKPIKMFSSSVSGQGLVVLETSDTSHIEHCYFSDLAALNSWGWVNTGAVNFYNAPVRILNSQFSKNNSEDALNIVRTWFEMEQVTFTDTKSDAFDGDFVEGRIRGAFFADLGNDAIDISGSRIVLEDIIVMKAGDKGLSAGEASEMKGRNIQVYQSEIGVASKDQSNIVLKNLVLEGNRLGFTAYQKKPEFGTSHIVADQVTLNKNELDYLIETASSLRINGTQAPTSAYVLDKMYGEEFGKASN